jgi:hypothetical protein
MKTKWLAMAAAAMLMALPATAQTVDEVIGKSIAAHGGMEKIKAIQSIRMSGRAMVGPGIEAPFTLEFKRPMKMRLDIVVQGISATLQAYDGKTGWQLLPFQGNKDAEPLSADDLKDVQETADYDGPLVDYKTKGNQVELMGKEDVEGTNCYKLKITLKNGDVVYDYIDTDSNLDVKQEGKRKINGTEHEIETSFGDYKQVDGVYFPFAIDSGEKGSDQRQKIIVEKVETNVPVEDARFVMPAPAPPPADTKPAETKPPLGLWR